MSENSQKIEHSEQDHIQRLIEQGIIRPCKVYVREGSYLPEQLGLYMEGVYAINVGTCTSFPNLDPTGFHGERAHAHPGVGVICFPDGLSLFSEPGVPDDVLIHEYCHILRGLKGIKDLTVDLHDETWAYYMRCYGLEPKRGPDYVYR
jgi:hypothetical protein